MKKIITSLAAAFAALALHNADAQIQNPRFVSYIGDIATGVSSNKTYTHAINFADNLNVPEHNLNGVIFKTFTAAGSGTYTAMNGKTYGWSGFPTEGSWLISTPCYSPSGSTAHAMQQRIIANWPNNPERGRGTLRLSGLVPGVTYEFTLFVGRYATNARNQKMTFMPGTGQEFYLEYDQHFDAGADRLLVFRYNAVDFGNGSGELVILSDCEGSGGGHSLCIPAFINEVFTPPLKVEGEPLNMGEPAPAYGSHWEVKSNDVIQASTAPYWMNAKGTSLSHATGWELWQDEGDQNYVLTNSGETASFTFTHPGYPTVLRWQFVVSNRLDVTADFGGSFEDSTGAPTTGGWFDYSDTFEVTAVPAPGHIFYLWAGDIPEGMMYANPLELPADRPRVARAVFLPQSGDTRFVATDGDDGWNGLTPATPKLTIRAAVDELCESGGTVMVAPGEYGVENAEALALAVPAAPGAKSAVAITNAVVVRGATGKAADVLVYRKPAAGNLRVFNLDHAGARLEFMTVAGGQHPGEGNGTYGGNIRIGANGGTVADCVVRDGSVASSSWASSGGNIGIVGANGRVLRCVITGGYPQGQAGGGGGVYMNAGRVESCLITRNFGNTDIVWGNPFSAGVYVEGTGEVLNCTIVRNTGYLGGAVRVLGSGKIANCVIVDNTTQSNTGANGGSVYCGGTLTNNIINCVTDVFVNNTCHMSGTGYGFVDADNENYRLSPAALARDKGAAGYTLESEHDLDGNPRVDASGIVDAGCYEYHAGSGLTFAFDGGPRRHVVPFTVMFTAVVENAAAPVAYHWDFGDGETLTTNAASFTHTYTKPGIHTVTATAVDAASPPVVITQTDFIHAAPAVICVAQDAVAPPAPPFDPFDRALPTLLEALAWAADGTLILVTNGTYNTQSLMLDQAVTLRGVAGDPREVTLRASSSTAPLVILNHPSARVENVTVREGRNGSDSLGANVRITDNGGTISNCVITAGLVNSFAGDGPGVYMRGAAGLVTHCLITGNTANNHGGDKAAGVKMLAGRLEHCLVISNVVVDANGTNNVGGVHASGGFVVNCTIVGNTGTTFGGLRATGGAHIINSVIACNTSTRPEVFNPDCGQWGGDAARFTRCFTSTLAPIPNAGCGAATPEAMFTHHALADYTPARGSPLINAGIDVSTLIPGYTQPEKDFAGNDRVIGSRVDVGCYESNLPGTLLMVR